MLNREKYAKEILDIVCDGDSVAIVNRKPVRCIDTACYICEYNYSCDKEFKKWANSEYVEPPVVWSKVAVDTPVLVRDDKKDRWRKRYFAKYENKHVYVWANGSTSWSTDYKKDIKCWQYTKLAKE